MTHGESVTMTEILSDLDGRTLAGARVYLDMAGGGVPRAELVRVLASYLEVDHEVAGASIDRLVAGGWLQTAASTVSLPAGGDARDTKES